MTDRFVTAKRKLLVYSEEWSAVLRDGFWYFIGFGAVAVLAIPFLVIDLLVLLVIGKDIQWFPATSPFDEAKKSSGNGSLGTGEALDLLESRKVPALHLVGTGEPSGFSKIGGAPEAPPQLEWPSWGGRPLAFLAQIDLSELEGGAVIEDLPTSGQLYFFYDQEQSTWGFDPKDRGSWRVLFCSDKSDLNPVTPPEGLAKHGMIGEKRLAARRISSYPSTERLLDGGIDISYEASDETERKRIAGFGGLPQHQMGGFPNVIQGDSMELECQLVSNGLYCGDGSGYADSRASELRSGARDWRLLLQLDSDDDIDMMWGDCGMLYFWVRAAGLKQRNFAETWMILQCS